MKQALFRHADGVWPNTAAMAFTVLGWPLGIALLGQAHWAFNALGVLLVALTLTWSAYFIHEFAHQAIFRTPQANQRWGVLMSWINGSCYASFDDLRRKHMRHHVERADVITFDVQAFLRALAADATKQGRKGRVSVSASALAQEASKHGAPITDGLPEAANEADVRGSGRPINLAAARKLESVPTHAHGDVYQGPPLVMPVGIKAVN